MTHIVQTLPCHTLTAAEVRIAKRAGDCHVFELPIAGRKLVGVRLLRWADTYPGLTQWGPAANVRCELVHGPDGDAVHVIATRAIKDGEHLLMMGPVDDAGWRAHAEARIEALTAELAATRRRGACVLRCAVLNHGNTRRLTPAPTPQARVRS